MKRIEEYRELAADIVAWIKNYADTNNLKSLVVGVSGGIDSAVVSTLCAKTGIPTYCCTIDVYSSDTAIKRAGRHIGWLEQEYPNVYHHKYELNNTYDTMVQNLRSTNPLSEANIKSRLRMITLYNVATMTNGIVVGTGNKVEDFGVGFFTRGGDGCVDISPIGDLMKSEVRELGRYLGVSDEIINAKPTDGLWSDGRTDEDQLKASYDELEWAMWYLESVENEIPLTDRQEEVLEIYKMWNSKNRFKMLPIPVYKLKN